MDKLFEAGAVVGAPPIPSPGSHGNPTNGGPGVAPTEPGAYLFYALLTELLNVQTAGGVTASASTLNQVATAITNMISAALAATIRGNATGNPGYLQIGIWCIQWGTHANSSDDESVSFPHTFGTACYGVLATLIGSNSSSNVNVQTKNYTTASFSLHAELQERPPNATGVFWVAIGID